MSELTDITNTLKTNKTYQFKSWFTKDCKYAGMNFRKA